MTFIRTGTTLHIATDTGSVCGAEGEPAGTVTRRDLLCGKCMDKSLNASEEIAFGNSPVHTIEKWMTAQYQHMPLRAYYDTAHWQTLRRLALEHYGSTCVLCNATPVQVHHRTYDRRGRERLDDLIVLCDRCHSNYHGKAA